MGPGGAAVGLERPQLRVLAADVRLGQGSSAAADVPYQVVSGRAEPAEAVGLAAWHRGRVVGQDYSLEGPHRAGSRVQGRVESAPVLGGVAGDGHEGHEDGVLLAHVDASARSLRLVAADRAVRERSPGAASEVDAPSTSLPRPVPADGATPDSQPLSTAVPDAPALVGGSVGIHGRIFDGQIAPVGVQGAPVFRRVAREGNEFKGHAAAVVVDAPALADAAAGGGIAPDLAAGQGEGAHVGHAAALGAARAPGSNVVADIGADANEGGHIVDASSPDAAVRGADAVVVHHRVGRSDLAAGTHVEATSGVGPRATAGAVVVDGGEDSVAQRVLGRSQRGSAAIAGKVHASAVQVSAVPADAGAGQRQARAGGNEAAADAVAAVVRDLREGESRGRRVRYAATHDTNAAAGAFGRVPGDGTVDDLEVGAQLLIESAQDAATAHALVGAVHRIVLDRHPSERGCACQEHAAAAAGGDVPGDERVDDAHSGSRAGPVGAEAPAQHRRVVGDGAPVEAQAAPLAGAGVMDAPALSP